ncbi:hypothetical protein HU830_04550 [Lactobacillus sp. DCY120]|uniref:Integrase catalytic domain-containing protein n=1 Tax=Bombilactobacillus apium TaxID=2675299 RepID=A0A850R716_9LACO|nr:hypothetical protein [Bombilactobacillus apium]
MDASKEIWFGSHKATLHLVIDDHSRMVVGAHFAAEETLQGYYHVLVQILHDFGAPAKFLTDNRLTFNYVKKRVLPQRITRSHVLVMSEKLSVLN